MLGINMRAFARQLRALIYKNFLVTVVRKPISFFFFIYAIPIAVLVVLLHIPVFTSPNNTYGISSPAPIRDLRDIIDKKLLVVRPAHIGSDINPVVDRLLEGIDDSLVQFIEDDGQVQTICTANLRGVSPCFASITFVDSPETTEDVPFDLREDQQLKTPEERKIHGWDYTIRVEPARSSGRFDANTHDNVEEKFILPLKLAINNAITGSDTRPEVFAFTEVTQEVQERADQKDAVELIAGVFVFALIVNYFFIIYRQTSFITAERESGMSQLVDSMGGGTAAICRVLSWIITFDLYAIPAFITFGALNWYLLFPEGNAGLIIIYQILLGFAINSSTVFAAAFFAKSRVSAIYVIGAFLLLSVGAQMLGVDPGSPTGGGAIMAVLFPSANQVFFTTQMVAWTVSDVVTDFSKYPPPNDVIMPSNHGVTINTLVGLLVLNIFFYPALAVLVEKFMHGIDYHSRSFSNGPKSRSDALDGVVAETTGLKKRFMPNIFENIFRCGTRKGVQAVDGVDLQCRGGQILCLVGPNGSGKTTTLHMMSGFISPTKGTVSFDSTPSQIGICPQRNTYWQGLSVKEHVHIWRQIKASNETPQEMEELISACDLEAKRESISDTLSGGQKRKLQLACMFIGGSSVCLIDECTSGLDPLSRRVIWDILLQQRAKRSIVFTTHFLDEVDVLADQIVILSKGRVKCQGTGAELKNLHGGGYRVSVPHDAAPKMDVQFPVIQHQDRMVYSCPDSRTAARLSSQFSAGGVSDISIAGPQFEDVFLEVADDEGISLKQDPSTVTQPSFEMERARVISLPAQVWVLFRKRWTILRRFWWPYLYVILLPLIIPPFMTTQMLGDYKPPKCGNHAVTELYVPPASRFFADEDCGTYCDQIVIAPPSANQTLYDAVLEGYHDLTRVANSSSGFANFANVQDGLPQLIDFAEKNRADLRGALFMGSEGQAPVIGFSIMDVSYYYASPEILNLWSELEGKVSIKAAIGMFVDNREPTSLSAIIYVVFFCLIQAVYPAAFVLYPAIERGRRVRSLEYTSGVRRGPLWIAYGLFDFMFVFVVALFTTIILSFLVSGFTGPVFILFPILALYGLAAILLGYVVAHFINGPLLAFITMLGINLLMYIIVAVLFSVGAGFAGAEDVDSITNGLVFGLNLVMPIGNVFRSFLVGFNVQQVGCRDGLPTPAESIYAHGGPILYLVLQVVALLLLIIWIEGDLLFFRRKNRTRDSRASDSIPMVNLEKGASLSEEVEAEQVRTERAESDLLRILGVDKSFGSNHAVQNVTLGLSPSDVTALLGPNGAGKSTLVNIIQSELSADRGRILLCGEDARTRSAQRLLGVCPQFDALDMMNTRQHLNFYARVKGIKDVKGNVNHIMERLGLTPHANTLATKLSGGNKRKLSLAIALIGAPPVVVLDEPTSAMDAIAKRSFWKLIQSIAPGRSVLLTTHSMEEADTLANRAAIISKKLLAVGTTEALREKYSNAYYVSMVLSSAPNSTEEEMKNVRAWVQESIPGSKLEREMLGGQVRFTIPGTDGQGRSPVPQVIELLEREKARVGIEYYSISGATLENVFLSVARENRAQEEDGIDRRPLLSRLFRR